MISDESCVIPAYAAAASTMTNMAIPEVERAAVVALLRHSDRSWSDLAARILEAGSALAILRERDAQPGLFDEEDSAADLAAAAAEIAAWQASGVGVHAILDATYPDLLRDIRERPPILFSRGDMRPDPRAIAVVGSRDAGDEGLRVAGTISTELVRRDITVVSGLAAGIDSAVHRAALSASGRTVAVVGTGINEYYPRPNRLLQDQIGAQGLLLSQFWPDAAPSKAHFPMRNAVMSGYCAATVVVEAGEHSGVRIQTRLALKHGRQVILRRELLALDWARALTEQPGVQVVASLDELLQAVERVFAERHTQLSSSGGIAGILG